MRKNGWKTRRQKCGKKEEGEYGKTFAQNKYVSLFFGGTHVCGAILISRGRAYPTEKGREKETEPNISLPYMEKGDPPPSGGGGGGGGGGVEKNN